MTDRAPRSMSPHAAPAEPLLTKPPIESAFLGLPVVTQLEALDAQVAILGIPHGIPYDAGRAPSHAAGGPAAIRARSARFARFLAHHDFDVDGVLLGEPPLAVVDCGDVPASPGDPGAGSRTATAFVHALLERGALPLVLGGDDSVPIMVLRAFEGRAPLHVVQIDAHLDFRDEVDGVRDGYSSTMRRATEMPWVQRILHVGLRGVGSSRAQDLVDSLAAGNLVVKAADVHREGIDPLVRHLPADAPCFVTIDLDGLDPAVAPGVVAPMPGGLRFEHVAELLRAVAGSRRLAGMAIVEHVPEHDVNGLTSLAVVRLVANALGALARARPWSTRGGQ